MQHNINTAIITIKYESSHTIKRNKCISDEMAPAYCIVVMHVREAPGAMPACVGAKETGNALKISSKNAFKNMLYTYMALRSHFPKGNFKTLILCCTT